MIKSPMHDIKCAGNALDLILDAGNRRPIHSFSLVIYKLVKVMKTFALWMIRPVVRGRPRG